MELYSRLIVSLRLEMAGKGWGETAVGHPVDGA